MTGTGKKLVEVALPLDEINAASKADKDRKTGTIRNLHKWFAPAPLPAWRALLFAALVDDPGEDNRRVYLLDLIKRLVANGADLPDQDTLDEARQVIANQFPDGVPTVMDPFCGGGSTLVEAQRLGLPTYGSDLNPVPVLITRTLTELLPKVYNGQPLHPEGAEGTARGEIPGAATPHTFTGHDGLIRDVTYYANRIRDQAWNQLQSHYPSQAGETPVAWLWARTAKCPNPTCRLETVLTTSWWLSKKSGDLAWIEPRVENGQVILDVVSGQRQGTAPAAAKTGRGTFACLACATPLGEKYLRSEGQAGRLGQRMTAVVVERIGNRTYRAVTAQDESAPAEVSTGAEFAQVPIVKWRSVNVPDYGIDSWDKLYTPRQLLTLTTFADLVAATHQQVLDEGGSNEWADALTTLLGLALGRLALSGSSQSRWRLRTAANAKAEGVYSRNDLPMMWDFAETFFRGGSVGDWTDACDSVTRSLSYAVPGEGKVTQLDARTAYTAAACLVATDPPYFDAIGYADLSDYFYVWHRRALKNVHPDLYRTVAAPKANELTAIPSHHGGDKDKARDYFVDGFTETFQNLQRSMHPDLPMLVIYASKEQSSGSGGETRWEAILAATIAAGLQVTGTWPIHMTSSTRLVGMGANAVAAYIVMVVRPRPANATDCSLTDFNRALRRELPPAITALQEASILPVDLPQAILGPGMQIFSRHRAVLDQNGTPITVGRAMTLISEALTEVLDEQQGELDPDSRFAVAWWQAYGWQPGPFGAADAAARPHGISVDDVVAVDVVTARGGKVTLLGVEGLDREWKPSTDQRPTAWEAVHHLADRLIDGGGLQDAAALMADLGDLKFPAQTLVYRLEDIAAKKGWAKDQERYNTLIASWTDLLAEAGRMGDQQEGLF